MPRLPVRAEGRRRRLAVLLLSFAAALLATFNLFSQTAADWTITAKPLKKVMANYPAVMSISITDAKGQPVTGASVELVTTMIDMDHGEKKSPAKPTAPGIYEGTVNFFMVGPWNLEVRATSGRQSKAQKIRFDVNQ